MGKETHQEFAERQERLGLLFLLYTESHQSNPAIIKTIIINSSRDVRKLTLEMRWPLSSDLATLYRYDLEALSEVYMSAILPCSNCKKPRHIVMNNVVMYGIENNLQNELKLHLIQTLIKLFNTHLGIFIYCIT
jgi:hypothetical protein